MQTKVNIIPTQLNLLRRAGGRALLLLVLALGGGLALADTISVTNSTPGAGSWTCPAGVTSVTVEMWGGGGGGGGINSPQPTGTYGSGGGGGGGAYTVATVSVTPGTSYSFTVGAGGTAGPSGSGGPGGKGGDTSFPSATTATGGLGGGGVPANSGLGNGTNGPGASGFSPPNHNGGDGAAGSAGPTGIGYSGGGGGSGSASIDGGNASTTSTNGGTAGPGGGAGANGRTGNLAGLPGNAPGGGGSGACASSSTGNQKSGGAGAAGRIVITFDLVLTASSLSVSGFPNPAAQGAAGSVTVAAKNSSGITVPSYTGTVTLTNNDPSGSSPVSHTFVPGDNGVFIFTNVMLNTLGAWDITASDGSLTGSQTNIQVVLPASSFNWINNSSGNWSAGTNWANDLGNGAAPMAAGQTNYALNFSPLSTCTATNDLNSGFLLNQLNFGGATVTLRGNSLAFTNDGVTGPAINQNNYVAVTVANDLVLSSSLTVGGSGSGTLTLSGVVSGAGSLTKDNAGTLILTQTNTTFTGGVILNQGTLAFQANDALGTNNTLTINGGTLGNPNGTSGNLMNMNASMTSVWAGDFTVTGNNAKTFNGPVILANGTRTVTGTYGAAGNTCTLAVGAIGDNGNSYGLTLVGNNTGTAGQKFTIKGASTYGGDTTVSGANPAYPMQLLAGVDDALPFGAGKGNLYLNDNGQLDVRIYSLNINGLNGTAQGTVTSSAGTGIAGTLIVGNANSNGTFAGVISSAKINLVKTGSGTQTLSGVNTYTWNTTISGGTLALSGSGSIANSTNLIVAGGAIFDVSGMATPFTLASALASQTLSNSAPGAIINGTSDCSAGTLSLVYDGVNPSFTIANGGMTLSAATTINVNNTGTRLAANTSYKLIAKGTAGLVAGAVTVNPVTVGGIGAAGMATLAITGEELYLNVGESLLHGTGTNIVVGVTNNILTMSWPTDYVGWELQSNAVSLTSSSDWYLVPGSATNSSMSFPVDPAKTSVFYRMRLP